MSDPVAIVIDTDVLPGADGMYRHDVLSEIRLPNQAELYLHPDPRVAELEAALRECRESLDAVTKWNAPPDFNGRKIDRIVEKAISKIDEVLK